MLDLGWKQSRADPQLYFRKDTVTGTKGAFLVAHVDDLLLAATPTAMVALMAEIESKAVTKWLAKLNTNHYVKFLGAEVLRWERGYKLRLPKEYYDKFIKLAGMELAKPMSTPAVAVSRQDSHDETTVDKLTHAWYRSCVGSAMYMVQYRPDMAFAVKELARDAASPSPSSIVRLKRLARYVRGTTNYELTLQLTPGELEKVVETEVDANWVVGKSTSGTIIRVMGFALSTASRTQKVVALSTCEAELLAASSGAQDAQQVKHLFEEITETQWRVRVLSDSESFVKWSARAGPGRMRHIDLRLMWMQEKRLEEKMEIVHIPGEQNVADALTKALSVQRFCMLREWLGVLPCAVVDSKAQEKQKQKEKEE
jgi:hypothetical protein